MTFCQDIYDMLSKKYPNSKIYAIGDQHLSHQNIIRYTRYNFSNVQEMNHYIIQKHNETVSKNDIVLFLGDYCFKKGLIKDFLQNMNGHKYLILGNHDFKDIIKNYPGLGFEMVFINPIKINNFYFSHEPLNSKDRNDLEFQLICEEFRKCSSGINFHGHIHEPQFFESNFQNLSCEVLDYKPFFVGCTHSQKKEERPLFINSPYFSPSLDEIHQKHGIDSSMLIADYIYSHILESLAGYQQNYFIQGSFGLLKKYNYLSKMSDVDISVLPSFSFSKSHNLKTFKSFVDAAYVSLFAIDNINLSFIKRYSSLRIFEALYTSLSSCFSQMYFDANLIFLNCYKRSDFALQSCSSLVEKYFSKYFSQIKSDFSFPTFQSYFLIPEGDIANILLQIMFQKEHAEKCEKLKKKLHYVYSKNFAHSEMENFENLFCRFFLRNIAFFYTLRRFDEINYIQNSKDFTDVLQKMPKSCAEQVSDIINSSTSTFSSIFEEIASTPIKETFQKCEELSRILTK